MGETAASSGLRKVVLRIKDDVEHGSTFAGALRKYPDVFPGLHVSIIETGELSGKLEKSLAKIADFVEKGLNVRRKLLTGLLYPLILIHLSILLPSLYVLILKGLPEYLGVIVPPLLILYSFLAAIFLAIKYSRRAAILMKVFDRFILFVPVLGPLLRKLTIGRFVDSMAVLLSAGLGPVRSIEIAAEGCGNKLLQQKILMAVPVVSHGGRLSDAMKKADAFPKTVIGMVTTGEESGKLDEMFAKVAAYYNAETDETIRRLVQVTPVAVYLAVALYIGYKVITFWSAYYAGIPSGI
jgi:type IV pilus assembly protein PilC